MDITYKNENVLKNFLNIKKRFVIEKRIYFKK